MSTLREQGINPKWLLERLAEDGYAELEGDFTDRTALRTMAHRVKDRVGEGLSIKTSLPKPTVLRVDVIPASEAVRYRPRNKSNGAKPTPKPTKAAAPVVEAEPQPETKPVQPQVEPVPKPSKAKRTRKTAITEGPLAEALAPKSRTRRHRQQQEKKQAAAEPVVVEPGTIGPDSIIRKVDGKIHFKVQEVRPNKAGVMEVHCVETGKGRGALRVFLLDSVVLVK